MNTYSDITDETMVVGIDIAKHIHWAQITDGNGKPITKPLKLCNSYDAFNEFIEKLTELTTLHRFKNIIVGFEPSGHYWKDLAWFLVSVGIRIVGVNPYHVKQLKELEDNSQTKNDKKDALVIAHLIRDGRSFEIYLPKNEYAELRVLKRHREQLSERKKVIINTIHCILDEFFLNMRLSAMVLVVKLQKLFCVRRHFHPMF